MMFLFLFHFLWLYLLCVSLERLVTEAENIIRRNDLIEPKIEKEFFIKIKLRLVQHVLIGEARGRQWLWQQSRWPIFLLLAIFKNLFA